MFSANKNLSFIRIILQQKNIENIDISSILFFHIDFGYFFNIATAYFGVTVAHLQQFIDAFPLPYLC